MRSGRSGSGWPAPAAPSLAVVHGRLTYLDWAASGPVRARAVDAMLPFLTARFGNPSGAHPLAVDARRALDDARDVVAGVLGADPSEIVFTGCGTEADNLALFGVHARRGGTVVGTAVEHHAVLHPVERLGGRVVPVGRNGVVDLDALADALDPTVSVVSVMAVNNEVGTVQPFAEVAALVRDRAPQAVVHTDAIQAPCWLDLRELATHVDLLSLSGHKFGGPKGTGVLMVRRGVPVAPLLLGGGQEHDRRSGTQDVAGAVALATALQEAAAEREATVTRVGALRDRLLDGLVAAVDGLHPTVPRAATVAGAAHVCIEGVESEAVLYLLGRAGICASAGSSCASGALQVSHVLAAMGVSRELAAGAVRCSLGYGSTDADIDHVLEVMPSVVAQLRREVRR